MARPAASAPYRLDRMDWLVLGIIALLYLLNRNPYLGWNDALSFMAEAVTGWSPYTNATSHFLYTNTLHVLFSALPFLDPVLVATLFSVLCGLGTLYRVMQLAFVFGADAWSRRLTVIALGTAFTFWQQIEGVEVYAFHNLLMAHFLLFAFRDHAAGERRRWPWVSVFLGLCLLTHIQGVLALPFFVHYLFTRQTSWGLRLGGIGIVAALAGWLFLLPALLDTHPLRSVFFEDRFRGDVLGLDLKTLLMGLAKGLAYLAYNFHLFLLPILAGWLAFWRSRHVLLLPLGLLLLPFLAFAIKYSVNDNHVFYLVPYMVLVLPMGLALTRKWSLGRFRPGAWLLALALVPVLLYASVTWGAGLSAPGRRYDAAKAYKGGLTHALWPGKAWARDPLALARELHAQEAATGEGADVEWNYPGALAYLKARGEL